MVVHQRNGVGVGPNSPLLLNFGLDFDIEAARTLGADDESFRGALDLLFESQKHHLADEAASNVSLAAAEAEAAKLEAEAAKQRLQDLDIKAKGEADSAAALGVAQEAEKAAAAENKKKEAELKRKLDEESCPDKAKRRASARTLYESPKGFSASLSADGHLFLNATVSTNVKIPKDGLLCAWSTDTLLKKNGEGFAYALALKTLVYDGESGKKMSLEKLIKDKYPKTKHIWKYKAFPAGCLPKVLQLEDDKKTYQFDSKAANKEAVIKGVEACRALQKASLLWKMRFNAKFERLEPDGLVLLANAAIVVPGDGESPVD